MKPQEKLARAVFRRYSMLPTWPVGHPVVVGDIISRTGSGVHRETSFERLLSDPAPLAIGQYPMLERIKLSDGVIAEIAANAGSLAGTAHIRFGARASFVMIIEGGILSAYDELWDVRKGMVRLYKSGIWDPSWQLVTSVRSADACTILVSDKAGVQAEARIRPGVITGDLLDALDVGSKVVWTTNGGLDSVAGKCTPLHSVLRVKKRPFGDPRTVERGVGINWGGNMGDEDDVDIVPVGPEEAGLAEEANDSGGE